MTYEQLDPLLRKDKKWNTAVIQTLFRQPFGIERTSKVEVVGNILIITDEDSGNPIKVDAEGSPLPAIAEIHVPVEHIMSVDYFTDKKIVSIKKPMIVVP